jgi:hypothetical protein
MRARLALLLDRVSDLVRGGPRPAPAACAPVPSVPRLAPVILRCVAYPIAPVVPHAPSHDPPDPPYVTTAAIAASMAAGSLAATHHMRGIALCRGCAQRAELVMRDMDAKMRQTVREAGAGES